jgi:hypothetical protein
VIERLLRRLRPAPPVSQHVVAPPRRWSDELGEAGVAADAWVARRLARGRLYVDIDDARLESLRVRYPRLVDATIDAASRILGHEFNLLGSGPYTPHDPDRPADAGGYRPIDWYLDPVSWLRFPKDVPISSWDFERMRPGRADIKLPWELSRCQHWAVLGQAYRLTRDDRFALELARELRDFMEANPIGTAVNWTCTMDVALRAVSWSIGLELVRSCPALSSGFWQDAYRALFDHGTFIETHLENTYEVTSNHFLSNVAGLFFLAAVFRDLPRGAAWDRQCRAWLAREMDVQVLPDGADYESSVPYHRLVAELFLGSARLADDSGQPLPSNVRDRLRTMIDFLAAVRRPDGLMPQVGDADDGRLHILSDYGRWRPQDASHLFAPAAGLFGCDDWRSYAGEWGGWERAWWGFDAFDDASGVASVPAPLRHFPGAGVTVFRRDRDYLLVTNGAVGTAGFGNHKHNDLLGFEFHVDGTPVCVDPGSYVYTSDPDARNLFRSTRSHNTVVVDDEEQNEVRRDWLFRMFEASHPEHLEVEEQLEQLRYRGRHRGYTRLSPPLVHERTFILSRLDGTLTIADAFSGPGRHRLRWHFHFAPGVDVGGAGAGRFSIWTGVRRLEMNIPEGLESSITPAQYSPSYGVRIPCLALDLRADERMDGARTFVFRIAP